MKKLKELLGRGIAIFDGATIADSENVYLTQELSHTTYTGTNASQVKWGAQTASQTASNWTAIGGSSVPEPTSGLLLLLGMAGLALKRKRA